MTWRYVYMLHRFIGVGLAVTAPAGGSRRRQRQIPHCLTLHHQDHRGTDSPPPRMPFVLCCTTDCQPASLPAGGLQRQ
ncbi:hypothetical protein EV126DRAFT_423069 [Verticillium dahliae]|nr:hypothetical protein EV126DRAFT_423069 [Verticillium dahliae]